MKKLRGITVPLLTPFNQDGSIDRGALRALVDFLIEKGVHALYPCGATGEMALMDVRERRLVAEVVVEQTRHRLPVFVQVGACSTRESVDLARHAVEIGSDGIGVVTPYYFKVTQEGMYDHFRTIGESVPGDFPVYLYNIPQLTGNDLLPRTVERLARNVPTIVGIKNSTADLIRIGEYLEQVGPDFSVVLGCDLLIGPGLLIGCDGAVSGNANVFPELFVELYEQAQAGNWETAVALQHKVNRIATALRNGGDIALFKEALSLRGLSGGRVRKPLPDVAAEDRNGILAVLRELSAIPQ